MTLFLMASGVTFVIMIGGIDLSIQAVASMTSCILAALPAALGLPPPSRSRSRRRVVGLARRRRLDPAAASPPSSPRSRSAASCSPPASGSPTRARSTFRRDLRDRLSRWVVGETFGVPNEIWVGLWPSRLLSRCCRLTPFGRLFRAIGSRAGGDRLGHRGRSHSRCSPSRSRAPWRALAGVVMAARLGSGSPTLANEFLLPAIAAVIVGGTAITGGVGHLAHLRRRADHLRWCASA